MPDVANRTMRGIGLGNISYQTYFTAGLPSCVGLPFGTPCRSQDGTAIFLPSCDSVPAGTACFSVVPTDAPHPVDTSADGSIVVESIDDLPDALVSPDEKSQLKRQAWWADWKWVILGVTAVASAAAGGYVAIRGAR